MTERRSRSRKVGDNFKIIYLSGKVHRGHRHRSCEISPDRNLKRRKNARRLLLLKQLEDAFKLSRDFAVRAPVAEPGKCWSRRRQTAGGLKGGGKKNASNWDFERLAKIIAGLSISTAMSKKEFWKSVAQNYFMTFIVEKRRIEQLRLLWRKNSGNLRDRVKTSVATNFCGAQQDDLSSDESNSFNNYSNHSSRANGCEENRNTKYKDENFPIPDYTDAKVNQGGIANFLGHIIGRTVITVYNENAFSPNNQELPTEIPTSSGDVDMNLGSPSCKVETKLTSSVSQNHSGEGKEATTVILQAQSNSSSHVYTIDNAEDRTLLNCFERLEEEKCDDNNFVNISCVSSTTAKTLSASNVPSSGTFRATLVRPSSLCLLPCQWRDIPIVEILGNRKSDNHRAFGGNYVAFFSGILNCFNSYCCWIFKKNYIKHQDSRKKSSPYWRGHAVCKYGDVQVHLKIASREEGVLAINFSGHVEHDVTRPKAKRLTGKLRQKLITEVWKSCSDPSKLHRDHLLDIDADVFSAGIRTGAGVTRSTMKGIKSESKKKHQCDANLANSLCALEASIKHEDEADAIRLGHSWRKFFGYIQFCNVTPDLNIVMFNEASVRIFHDLAKQDIIYIDATGKLFANEQNKPRLLYYAMVLRNPYALNSPLPVSELISSSHTAESIGLMIRKLIEREKLVFDSKITIPSLVMSDFSLAIITACLKEFNSESYNTFLERGYRIVTGKADDSDATKTIHHVCSAHMMQIIKKHAKELSEKNLPLNSQVHIAMRFFGRLITSNTLKEMKYIVQLGHYIFKSKYIDDALKLKLDEFSDNIHDFNMPARNADENDESCCEIVDSDDEWLNVDAADLIQKAQNSACTSMEKEWESELLHMDTNGVKNGDLNKYFMPKYFDYIFKNYLPSCLLWSGLLLGDLRRHNIGYSFRFFNPTSTLIRNSQVDNNTNAEVENFFKIKKHGSFKGKRHLRVDTFIGENWADNKALQRYFVESILQGVGQASKRNFDKVEQLCKRKAANLESSSDNSDVEEVSRTQTHEEQWNKSTPTKSGARKKGKYLSTSQNKLRFNPELPSKPKQLGKVPKKDINANFDKYEKSVWNDVAAQSKLDFVGIKNKIKQRWNKLNAVDQEKYMSKNATGSDANERFSHEFAVNESPPAKKQEIKESISNSVRSHNQTCCVCRQARYVNAIQCLLCRDFFHLDCIQFNEHLAFLGGTNYFCTNCIFINFTPFLKYMLNSTSNDELSKSNKIAELYDEYVSNNVPTIWKDDEVQVVNVDNDLQISAVDSANHNRGIVNKKSNCWLSSVLHCLASTPLLKLLNKWRNTSNPSGLLNSLARTLENVSNVSNKKAPPLRLCDGPLDVAQCIGMIPDTRDHKDAHECFTKILGDIHSEIFQFESDELSALYQWKLFTLNRCLVPECQKISGKRVVMWTYPIQVPIINDTINMQSLLWTHSTGRFTTEEDEVCKSCSCKPAAHHVELIDVMPKILTFSINRIQCNQFGNLQRVYTPILCDLRINLRGMTARNFDEI